jgi:hypothetical protein
MVKRGRRHDHVPCAPLWQFLNLIDLVRFVLGVKHHTDCHCLSRAHASSCSDLWYIQVVCLQRVATQYIACVAVSILVLVSCLRALVCMTDVWQSRKANREQQGQE